MDKKYKIVRQGTGHISHMLENVDDPTDKIFLCSCGGTKDPMGYCDGTHKTKLIGGCQCAYCLPIDERVKNNEIA
jgi:CDGSH-type Zn-finger protein